MEQKEVVLINKGEYEFTINFKGAFPHNKRAMPGAKYYLTDKEWDWVQHNLTKILEKGILALEGTDEAEKEVKTNADKEKEYAKFFKQHVNKAKAQIAKMDDLKEINALIDYANDNEINNKAVDALVERANELGE